jgi:hypothetical protein
MNDQINPEIREEIARARRDLEKKLDNVNDISDLVGNDIDREYPVDFNELSETELETEMAKRVVYLNENLNIINQINQKTGNKVLKIILLAPYSIKLLFKSVGIMKNYLQLNHIMLVRMKRMAERLEGIENRLNDLDAMRDLPGQK